MTNVRSVMRYHGGKNRLAPWIIEHLPPHLTYVEPFCGAANVLFQKERSYAEVINDMDDEVVNVFRVLRDDRLRKRLAELCHLTPFAQVEFKGSYEPTDDPIERARRTLIRAAAGHGSAAVCKSHQTGFRRSSRRTGSHPAMDWAGYPSELEFFAERLRGVVIESGDALSCMACHDAADTLHYVDPPYLPETRRVGAAKWRDSYRHEMTPEDHERLLIFLRGLRGMVVLSGYPSSTYDNLLPEWRRVERSAHADGARDRTEVLWINPAASQTIQPGLFGGGLRRMRRFRR